MVWEFPTQKGNCDNANDTANFMYIKYDGGLLQR